VVIVNDEMDNGIHCRHEQLGLRPLGEATDKFEHSLQDPTIRPV
jgi:hypothetical protein